MTSSDLLLLATENPTRGSFRMERPAPGVVAAITAGDGEPTNPKLAPNEDSLALVALAPGTTAALIADAHFGPAAGEIAARMFARAMRQVTAHGPGDLRRVLVELDLAIHAERAPGDASETTAIAAVFRPGRITWASVGDSVLFVASLARALERVTPRGIDFLGGKMPLEPEPVGATAGPVVDCGSIALPAGAVALMASDGIDPDYSGLSEARLSELLLAPGPLDARVARLMSEAGSASRGGGRDNLTVVAVTST